MTKAEQIVKNLQDKGIHTYNLSEQVDILSAMEEQSIKFAEWAYKNGYTYSVTYTVWTKQPQSLNMFEIGECYPTSELYKLFNEL